MTSLYRDIHPCDSWPYMGHTWSRPSKCLQHHQHRWCKILWTSVNLLLLKYGVLLLIDFWSKFYVFLFVDKMVVITYFYFSYLINCYYVAVLYSLVLKTLLLVLKWIWLNTSYCRYLNDEQIYAVVGVNFGLLKSCWCKILDI